MLGQSIFDTTWFKPAEGSCKNIIGSGLDWLLTLPHPSESYHGCCAPCPAVAAEGKVGGAINVAWWPPPVLQREQLLTVALQGPSTNNDSQSSQEFGNSRDHSDMSSVRVWELKIQKYSKYANYLNTQQCNTKIPKYQTTQNT